MLGKCKALQHVAGEAAPSDVFDALRPALSLYDIPVTPLYEDWLTRTEILPFCPLVFAAGRLGGGTQKTGKNIALSVVLKGGSVESAFLPHFVECGFLGVFVRFFAFVRFFCGGLAMGVYPPKRAKPAD